jgi:hypothetical protein
MGGVTALVVDVVVALGLVVVLPLGLSLLGPGVVPGARSKWWPAAGAVTAAGTWLPRGPLAQVTVVPFLLGAAVLLVAGALVVLRPGPTAPRPAEVRLAVGVALAMPAVGATAMLADRGGWGLLGFSGTYLTLTVPHMLFAGFAAALVAGLTAALATQEGGAGAARRLASRLGAAGVPLGTVLVLVGYFVGDAAELVGALTLTLALWCTSWAALGVKAGRGARALLATGALTVVGSMMLAVWWAFGEATGTPHPGIGTMAATHGVANALGFVLCTMLGLRLAQERAGDEGPVPTGRAQGSSALAHRPGRTPGRRQA